MASGRTHTHTHTQYTHIQTYTLADESDYKKPGAPATGRRTPGLKIFNSSKFLASYMHNMCEEIYPPDPNGPSVVFTYTLKCNCVGQPRGMVARRKSAESAIGGKKHGPYTI